MRLGVLGGTFDPPHIGHLVLAECARDQLALDRVLWVPAADPPHKHGQPVTAAYHRVAMTERALRGNPHFALSRADLDRPGPHYTVDLMDILAGEHPRASFYFLMGGDSLHDLPTWHAPARLIEQCKLGVMPRPDHAVDLDELEAVLPGLSGQVIFVSAPLVELSSTQIAERVRAGQTIRYLVPLEVERYIEKCGIYRPSGEENA